MTNLEVMLRFYEFFDPSEYQNTERMATSVTVIEEKEIAEGHYENHKYEDSDGGTEPGRLNTPSPTKEASAK